MREAKSCEDYASNQNKDGLRNVSCAKPNVNSKVESWMKQTWNGAAFVLLHIVLKCTLSAANANPRGHS